MNKDDASKHEAVDLFVKEAFVNQGPTLKRISPAPMGRAYRIRKRSNHLTIVVATKDTRRIFLGQKTNPIGLRVGIIRGWESNWYENKSYAAKLKEDERLRDYVRKRLKKAGISQNYY